MEDCLANCVLFFDLTVAFTAVPKLLLLLLPPVQYHPSSRLPTFPFLSPPSSILCLPNKRGASPGSVRGPALPAANDNGRNFADKA